MAHVLFVRSCKKVSIVCSRCFQMTIPSIMASLQFVCYSCLATVTVFCFFFQMPPNGDGNGITVADA